MVHDSNTSNKTFVQVDCFESVHRSGLGDCDCELLVKILACWSTTINDVNFEN